MRLVQRQSGRLPTCRHSLLVSFADVLRVVGEGFGAAWHLAEMEVEEATSGQKYVFPCGRWLSKSEDDKQICRELTCANLQSPRSRDKLCEHNTIINITLLFYGMEN